jgi:hypothetical protein
MMSLRSGDGAIHPLMVALFAVGVFLFAVATHTLLGLLDRDRSPERHEDAVLRALIGSAPLLGLLGTVTGIVTCFEELSTGGVRVDALGQGVGEALYATQYGLALAIPGIFLERVIAGIRRRRLSTNEGVDR